MRNRNLLALISGIAFIVLGVVFAADALDWIDVSAQLVFPVVLIAVGVGVVLGSRGRRTEHRDDRRTTDEPRPAEPPKAEAPTDETRTDEAPEHEPSSDRPPDPAPPSPDD